MVSALRRSQAVSASVLDRVATHVYSSQGRPSCHSEVVPLQFVFGPEHSLEKFREVRAPRPLPMCPAPPPRACPVCSLLCAVASPPSSALSWALCCRSSGE